MVEVMWSIIWAAVCYAYAKNVKEKYPDIDIQPLLYVVGGLLFAIFPLIFCIFKKKNYEKYHK